MQVAPPHLDLCCEEGGGGGLLGAWQVARSGMGEKGGGLWLPASLVVSRRNGDGGIAVGKVGHGREGLNADILLQYYVVACRKSVTAGITKNQWA